MIIPQEVRVSKLISQGVPVEFLEALDDTSKFEDLEFIVNGPDSAYWYLQDIYPKYECIQDYDVTPIYCGSNNDTFYVLLSRDDEIRFVYFGLEDDAIYTDFGSNFMFMLANFMIEYYEFADSVGLSVLGEIGVKLGLKKAPGLMSALQEADDKGLRKSFELDKAWREENVPSFI